MELSEPRTRHGAQYTTLEWDVEELDSGEMREAHLTVMHHGDGRYTTSLRNVKTSSDRGFKVTSFSMFSGIKLPVQQLGQRFSQKNLGTAVQKSLSELRIWLSDDLPEPVSFFTPEAVTV